MLYDILYTIYDIQYIHDILHTIYNIQYTIYPLKQHNPDLATPQPWLGPTASIKLNLNKN